MKMGIKASQIEVENYLQKINNPKYPKEAYIACSSEYCLSDKIFQRLSIRNKLEKRLAILQKNSSIMLF